MLVLFTYMVAMLLAHIQAEFNSIDIVSGKTITRGEKTMWSALRCVVIPGAAMPVVDATLWAACIASIGALALYTAWFRLCLCKSVGWHPCYLGSTSIYDVEILRWVTGDPRHLIRHNHQALYRVSARYRTSVHRAGAWAYGLEVAVAVGMAVVVAIRSL